MTHAKMQATPTPSSARTIGVYQRLLLGKPPSRVQILRSTYSSTKADGKTYGRTTNTYLHSVPSGTFQLGPDDEKTLRSLALTDAEIESVNAKLSQLVEAARQHAALYRNTAVSLCVQRLATLVAEDVDCRAMALDALRNALGAVLTPIVAQDSRTHRCAASSLGIAHPECRCPLEAAADVLDQACTTIVESAKRHRDAGLRLTSQRSIETTAPSTANALDQLQARANRIRRESFPAFELACKTAGLMVSKSSA